jgi:hypothetical protein
MVASRELDRTKLRSMAVHVVSAHPEQVGKGGGVHELAAHRAQPVLKQLQYPDRDRVVVRKLVEL